MPTYIDRPRTAELALNRPSPAFWPLLAAVALLAAAIALAWPRGASAAHVTPVPIVANGNLTCSELEGEGQSWNELKVDPNQNGTFSDNDGPLTVTITNTTDDKTFDWTSNIGVDAVFVKAGSSVGHYLYRYDPPFESTGDDGLTSPGGGSTNQISHISFCYDLGGSTPAPSPPTPTPAPATATPAPSPTPGPSPSPAPTALAAVALPNTGDSPGHGGSIGVGLIAGLAILGTSLLTYAVAARSGRRPEA